jgi:hypothetical protein
LLRSLAVEPGERFIEEQHGWLVKHTPSKGQAL